MAIQNRNTTLPGIWAENAQTTIPTPPVAGVTYRDTTLNSTAIDKAWPFKTIVDSSDFNQHAFLQDTLIKEAEQYGVMRWNNTTTYKEGGFCLGQDGKLYQAKRDNQGKEPTANADDWGIYPELSPYQLKSNLSQAIDSSTEKYPSNKAVLDAINSKTLSVGLLMPFAGDIPPPGWLRCDGAAISRITYANLFAVIGTKYGVGDRVNTFNIPNFVNRTFWGGLTSGAYLEGTLPNITGTVGNLGRTKGAIFTGAFYDAGNNGDVDYSNVIGAKAGFDASRSSNKYQNGALVRPESIQTMILIKY